MLFFKVCLVFMVGSAWTLPSSREEEDFIDDMYFDDEEDRDIDIDEEKQEKEKDDNDNEWEEDADPTEAPEKTASPPLTEGRSETTQPPPTPSAGPISTKIPVSKFLEHVLTSLAMHEAKIGHQLYYLHASVDSLSLRMYHLQKELEKMKLYSTSEYQFYKQMKTTYESFVNYIITTSTRLVKGIHGVHFNFEEVAKKLGIATSVLSKHKQSGALETLKKYLEAFIEKEKIAVNSLLNVPKRLSALEQKMQEMKTNLSMRKLSDRNAQMLLMELVKHAYVAIAKWTQGPNNIEGMLKSSLKR